VASPDRAFKDSIYEQFARIGKAFASPKRLELLDLLGQGERTVEVLAELAGLTVANASRHLQVLRAARLVETEKRGWFAVYRLAGQAVGDFFLAVQRLAEGQLAEVESITRRYLEGRLGLEPVDRKALLKKVRRGEVTVLDVRPAEEYRAGHLPAALSIPLQELPRRLSKLPRGREIVAYCRGPYCVLAVAAVELLRAQGFRAARLEEGVQDWRALGLPLAVGDER
jgi:rhodanese-related sulfurtransferase